MDDAHKLLTDNLIEALRQIQNYLFVALGSSVSAAALALRTSLARSGTVSTPVHPNAEAEASVPGIPVPMTPSTAHFVLWALTIVAGFMAGNSARSAHTIAVKLSTVPGLLEAVSTFPSIATSTYPVVRFLPILVSPVLAAVAVWTQLHRENAPITAKGTMVFILVAVYVPLSLEMVQVGQLIGAP
jgi:hypothetical protein